VSLFKKLANIVKPILKIAAPIAAVLPGIGPVVSGALALGSAIRPVTTALRAANTTSAWPGAPGGSSMSLIPVGIAGLGRSLPALGRSLGFGAGGVIGGAAMMGVRGARAVTRSAMTYCRRHPQWCGTIGGVAAVEALVGQGQLPLIKRSRGRGISASDLRKFKRVSRVLGRYCAPIRKAQRAPAMRRGGASCP